MKITIGPISLDILLIFRLCLPAAVFIGLCTVIEKEGRANVEASKLSIRRLLDLSFFYHPLPATCLIVALTRLKRLVVAIMRIRAASPFSS